MKWISESWKKINFGMIKNSFEFCGYGIDKNIEPKWKKYYSKESAYASIHSHGVLDHGTFRRG